jgi:hypothetical protein
MTLVNNKLYNILECYTTKPTAFESFILHFDSYMHKVFSPRNGIKLNLSPSRFSGKCNKIESNSCPECTKNMLLIIKHAWPDMHIIFREQK